VNTEEAVLLFHRSDPLTGARSLGLAVKLKLLEMEGGVMSQTEAAARLGISRHALDRRRIEGKLLALPLGAKDYRYPVWQFGLAGIEKVFAALGDRDPWEQISFFLNPNGLLDDSTPLQMLKQGSENLAAITLAAASYGEQGG